MKRFTFYLAVLASAAGVIIALAALLGLLQSGQRETTVFLSAMFALSNAAIAYSIHMVNQGKDIGHKTYPASLVSLLLVILMIYRWWSF
ncbi:hypothetical protein [Pseudoteredinibacter isoporae]|uniref:Uncharacterized protein n=1 Tax=Pseudoteredinibacter isoporae TaxID=570281 RepID=A0A7X0JSV6_9GAMM|nr:hypothetical protein [Pseudoteredinibacter isoporae]MBB6520795.1 hypothetical protein [Pseudoteredinibacter isoporae]NHO86361.1 hypothetical protein [Pseudoteredinibacter isoporae]NIB25187.1 hypothetical protein [Pseudoteredinibacter isoporae]